MKQINKLIEVTAPYNALNNIDIHKSTISADITQELYDHAQTPGITLSEAGRHMAILGSLAVANVNPVKEKHFYLASHAIFERVNDKSNDTKIYKGYMTAIDFNPKKAIAHGTLHDENNSILYRATVKYNVLTVSLFERFFKQYKVQGFKANGQNPYSDIVQLKNLSIHRDTSHASLGVVNKDWCLGHFDNYPALPVAQISQALMNLSALHNNKVNGTNEKFCVKKVIMDATSFIFANETLNVNSDHKLEENYYHTTAYTERVKNAVTLKCWLY